MNKRSVFRIGECIFDLTLVAYDIIEKYNLDVDSREVYAEAFSLAIEFEGIFDEDTMDYMTEIEEFGYKKFSKYFGVDMNEYNEEHNYDVTICYTENQTIKVHTKTPDDAVDIAVEKLCIESPISYIVEDDNGNIVSDGCF